MKRRTFLVGGAAAAGAAYGFGVRAAGGGAQTAPFAAPAPLSVGDAKEGEDLFAWLDARPRRLRRREVPRSCSAPPTPIKKATRRRGWRRPTRRRAPTAGGCSRTPPSARCSPTRSSRTKSSPSPTRRSIRRSRAPHRALDARRARPLPARPPEDEIKGDHARPRQRRHRLRVKLMSNDELIAVGRKVFNPLPGSNVGAQRLHGRAHPAQLADRPPRGHRLAGPRRLVVRGRRRRARHQPGVERRRPGGRHRVRAARRAARPSGSRTCCRTACSRTSTCRRRSRRSTRARPRCGSRAWPASADANALFDITVEKMRRHAAKRTGRFGLYFETGQGADAPTATARASTW